MLAEQDACNDNSQCRQNVAERYAELDDTRNSEIHSLCEKDRTACNNILERLTKEQDAVLELAKSLPDFSSQIVVGHVIGQSNAMARNALASELSGDSDFKNGLAATLLTVASGGAGRYVIKSPQALGVEKEIKIPASTNKDKDGTGGQQSAGEQSKLSNPVVESETEVLRKIASNPKGANLSQRAAQRASAAKMASRKAIAELETGNFPGAAIGGSGTPREMPARSNPNAAALKYIRHLFGGEMPMNREPLGKNCLGCWKAKLKTAHRLLIVRQVRQARKPWRRPHQLM